MVPARGTVAPRHRRPGRAAALAARRAGLVGRVAGGGAARGGRQLPPTSPISYAAAASPLGSMRSRPAGSAATGSSHLRSPHPAASGSSARGCRRADLLRLHRPRNRARPGTDHGGLRRCRRRRMARRTRRSADRPHRTRPRTADVHAAGRVGGRMVRRARHPRREPACGRRPDGTVGQTARLARVLDALAPLGNDLVVVAIGGAGHAARVAVDTQAAVSDLLLVGTPLGPVSLSVLTTQPAADALRLLHRLLPAESPTGAGRRRPDTRPAPRRRPTRPQRPGRSRRRPAARGHRGARTAHRADGDRVVRRAEHSAGEPSDHRGRRGRPGRPGAAARAKPLSRLRAECSAAW